MKNWDDLRLFLAASRAGSSRAAARALGVNQSTVSRRIRVLEERSAVRLFDRLPGGLALTEAGEELFELAIEVEERIDLVDRRLQGRDVLLAGSVRVSMPDFMVRPTAALLGRFSQQYPEIDVEVTVDNGLVSLTHREADLVLRLSASPPSQLVGRRVTPVLFCVYGSEAYLADRALPIDPSAVHWVRWDESWRTLPMERWIDANVAPEQVRARVNTSLALTELLASDLGVGFQPCPVGDNDPRFRRATATFDFGLVLWVLTHEDLRRTGRVRVLLRFLADGLAEAWGAR